MDLVSHERLILNPQILGVNRESSIPNGLMNLRAGLNTAKRRKGHIVFLASYLGIVVRTKKLDMRHSL